MTLEKQRNWTWRSRSTAKGYSSQDSCSSVVCVWVCVFVYVYVCACEGVTSVFNKQIIIILTSYFLWLTPVSHSINWDWSRSSIGVYAYNSCPLQFEKIRLPNRCALGINGLAALTEEPFLGVCHSLHAIILRATAMGSKAKMSDHPEAEEPVMLVGWVESV